MLFPEQMLPVLLRLKPRSTETGPSCRASFEPFRTVVKILTANQASQVLCKSLITNPTRAFAFSSRMSSDNSAIR